MAEAASIPSDLDAWKVDFKWKKLKGVITDNKTNEFILEIDCKRMMKPHLIFKTPDDSTVGTASLNMVSIHAECDIRGRTRRIQAMKRWKTEYTYLSDAFADGGLPVAMYWTSSSGFKHWDFILLDSNKEPVARFRSNVWCYKKLGLIEFQGNYSQRAKEEILITGFTVYYNMLLRVNNVFQLFGAMGAKTGPLDAHSADSVSMHNISAQQPEPHADSDPVQPSNDTVIR